MTLEQLSIRIEKDDLRRIKLKVKDGQYKSISEFIKLSISEKLRIFPFDFIFDEKKISKNYKTNIKFIKEQNNILLGEKYE